MVSAAASRFTVVTSSTNDAAPSATPKDSAWRGAIRPPGIGRVRVRLISASMSRSYQQLIALAPAAASQPPTTVARTSVHSGTPRAAMIIAATAVTSRSTMTRGLVMAR